MRRFDLSLFFQGVNGVDKYNDGKQITDYDSRPFNHSTEVLGAWSGGFPLVRAWTHTHIPGNPKHEVWT